jgi:1,4-alpha-glucan branching enzyme
MSAGRPARSGGDRGALAIVLHTHMPYVEGFGTWPFGEEWLWEAMVGCYLPLLEVLDRGVPLTLSVTPVLADQLEAPGLADRFHEFVGSVREFTHREDAQGMRAAGHEELASELQRAGADYQNASAALRARGDDLLGALCRHAQWTSSATHAILPLIGTDAVASVQVHAGIDAHTARCGAPWRGGFWLPECAHAPHLEPLLARAGVLATCVELTGRFGLGGPAHLRPRIGEAGVVLVPIDRALIDVVWGRDGYPSHGAYRDYHARTLHNHCPWANNGEPYDRERAQQTARAHAADFVSRARARLAADGTGLPGGGLLVCAFDTELFGHWWYEGPTWLSAVVEECSRQGVELVGLDDAVARSDPEPLARDAEPWEASSWGEHGDLSTWSGFVARPPDGRPVSRRRVAGAPRPGATEEPGPGAAGEPGQEPDAAVAQAHGAADEARATVAELAFQTRACELSLIAAGDRAGDAAVRALIALQASDWVFMIARKLATEYAMERLADHRQTLERALGKGPDADGRPLRNIAPHASAALLARVGAG